MCFSRNPDQVKLYMGKFLDDEKWQGDFSAIQNQVLLRFFQDWLSLAIPSKNIDDEYRRLRAMLDAALSFDPDDQ